MAGGEIIGKFCILTLVVFFFCRISWAQAPLQIRCVDKLCKGHIGHGVVSQNYNGDEKNKLRFKEGEKLTIIGVGDNYFLARSSDNEAAGLVAKHFIKRPEITGEPEIEVEVASLLNSQPPMQDAKEVEPTPPVGCMVDGTSVADPEVCSQTSSVSPVDVSSDDSSGTTTVSTPALPEDATTASLMTFISKTIEQTYSTFASAIDPSERSREIVPNTETVTQEKSQEPSNSLGPNIAADIASTETSDDGVPENLAGEANPQVVVAKEPGVDNPVPQNLSDADTAASGASPEPLVKNEEKVSVQPTVPPPAAQGKETTDEKSESGVGTNDSVHETAAASEVVREEPQGKPSEVVTEKAPPQEPPPASTEAPSIVKEVLSSEKSESGPPAPEKLADATSGDGQAPGSPKIKEPTLPNPTPETGSSASVESVIKPSEGVLAPSSGLPVTDGSPASQTKELPKPKVTAGNKPPKDLPPANRIRPTTAGHSHFHTRNAHAHSHDHGHSHGHAHGHSHSHGHSHHDHVAPIAPTPEEQNSQSYSYPGEKPVVDRVPEKPTQAGPPAEKPTQPGPPAEKPTQPGPPAEKPTQPGPPAETTQPVPPAEKPTQSGLPAETTQPAPPAENTPRGAEDKPSITPEEAKSTEKLGKKEPEQYKVNTVEQICERNDGVGCDGEPVSTKPAEQKIPSSKPRTEDSALREYVGLILSTIPEPVRGWFMDLERSGISSHVIVLTALCGVLATFLVAFFSFITHSSKESALLDYVARLEQQLFTLKKEREVLLEEPRETTQVPDEILERHEEQIRVLQSRKAILESELACSKESILQYREALREAQETIAGMEVEYSKKQEELMEEVNELRIERASSETILEEKDNKMSELRDTNAQLLQEAQIWDERLRELTAKLDEVTLERDKANKQLSASATEIESLKTGLKSLSVLEKAREAADDTEDEDEVIARLLEVQTVSAENESLKERNAALEEETEEAKAQLEKWRIEVESLKNDVKQALKQKQDSEQKLQVLTDYFKDKELTLQRDVVKQESLRQQKENDALGINEQLELYREQNITIQTQLTAVKEELEISERRYKRQLMEHEKRAHDNWMAYKNASKTVEELQNELQILRQQLNQFQKDRDAVERMVNLPQNRPRPPPPLPLPKGVIPMGIPPIPLPNGVFKDLPSPPMGRYIEGARRTPPAGVPLPSVLYQSKALSSRHSSAKEGLKVGKSSRSSKRSESDELKTSKSSRRYAAKPETSDQTQSESVNHSVRSGGSRGGIVSPDLRRSSNHRRSDRGDRSKDSNR